MAVIAMPRIIREKFGEEAAEALLELFTKVEHGTHDTVLEVAEEKFERRLTEEISKIDKRLTEEISAVRIELGHTADKLDKRITEEGSKLDKRITEEVNSLRVDLAKTRADLLFWIFVFWAGQIGVLTGLFALFRK